jgi:cytochrome c5
MTRKPLGGLLAAAALALAPLPAQAQLTISTNLKTGEQVYRETCIACHEAGVAHAPKFGDKEAWAPLIAEGQHVLTGHAWVGVRAMPAKGGNPELKLVEFARGVAYMASKAGADWKDPDVAMMRKILKEADGRLDLAIRDAQAMKQEIRRLSATTR